MTNDAGDPSVSDDVEAFPSPPPSSSYWLTPASVARLLDVSKMTIYRMIEADQIAHYRIGRQVRISRADFDAYLAAARHEVTPR